MSIVSSVKRQAEAAEPPFVLPCLLESRIDPARVILAFKESIQIVGVPRAPMAPPFPGSTVCGVVVASSVPTQIGQIVEQAQRADFRRFRGVAIELGNEQGEY